ncbi:MAG: hypothetical protein WCG91_01385 [Candidatus Shapirobacteria bacterium]
MPELKGNNETPSVETTPKKIVEQKIDQKPEAEASIEKNEEINSTNSEIKQINKEIEEISQPDTTSKEALINRDWYYIRREETIFPKGFIDSHQTQLQEHAPEQKNGFIDKVVATPYILKLKTLGVKNATEFYNALKQRGFSNEYIAVNEVVKKLEGLSIKDITSAIDKFNKLGFHVGSSDLASVDFKELIIKINSVPDAQFDSVCSELNPYSFLNDLNMKKPIRIANLESHKTEINPFLNSLIETVQNGKIDPEIKKRLDIIKEIILLDPTNKEDISSLVNIKREQLTPQNIFNKDSQISFHLPEGSRVDDDIFEKNFKFIYQNIDKFNNPEEIIRKLSQKQIDKLQNNDKGVADFLKKLTLIDDDSTRTSVSVNEIITFVTRNQDKISSSFKDQKQMSDFILELAETKTSDTESQKRDTAYFIENLKNINISEVIFFPITDDRLYWQVFSNTLDREFAGDFITKKDIYFDSDNSLTPLFFETILKNGEFNNRLIVENFNGYIKDKHTEEADFTSKFSPKDTVFWKTFYYNSYSYRDRYHKFVSNLDELKELLGETDAINPEFFTKIANEYEGKGYLEWILTDEILDSLPAQDKVFWTLFKDLNGDLNGGTYIDKLLELKENFSQYFNEKNEFNSSFFEMLNHNFDLEKLKEYLTLENIEKLENPQEKLFWNVYKSLLPKDSDERFGIVSDSKLEIRNFLNDNQAEFYSKYITPDNKLSGSFIFDVSKIKYINEKFTDVFSQEFLDNLDPKEKMFWTFYCNADVYTQVNFGNKENTIREILISNKDDYSKLLNKDGFPTSLLFELATKLSHEDEYKHSIINLSNLSDEVLNTFSPQDKAFWTAYRDCFFINGELKEDDLYIKSITMFLTANHSDFSKFLDNNYNFNSLFLESIVKKNLAIPDRFLTDEKLSFLTDGKKIWEIIRQNNMSKFNEFVLNNKDQLDQFFDNQNIPTFIFYENAMSQGLIIDTWKHLLTTEQISNFPEESRKFSYILKSLVDKECPTDILNLVIKNQNNIDLFFNKEGQITNTFLEAISKIVKEPGYYQNFIINSLLTPEIIKTFPLNEQKFWDTILNIDIDSKYLDSYRIRQRLFQYKDNIDQFIDNNNKPTASFFKSLISSEDAYSLGNEGFIFNYFTPELIESFSEADKSFINKFNLEILKDFNEAEVTTYRAFLIKNQDNLDTFFDTSNNPSSLLIESLILNKDTLNDKNIINKFLSSEILNTFSTEDQNFWSLFRRDTQNNEGLEKFLIKHKNEIDILYNPDDLSVTLSFIELAINENYSFRVRNLVTPDFIKNRPESETKFWNNLNSTNEQVTNIILKNIFENEISEIENNPFFKLISQDKLNFFDLSHDLDIEIGKYINQSGSLSQKDCKTLIEFGINISRESIISTDQIEINQSNYKSLLILYIKSQQDGNQYLAPILSKLEPLFNESKTKNFCLQQLQDEWKLYLNSGETGELSFSLKLFSKFVTDLDSAGPLSQIKSLSLLIDSVDNSFSKKTTVQRSKEEILSGLLEIEDKKWSNEAKTNFYNISKDIIDAAPSLFSDYLSLFKKLPPAELKRFVEEIYPLYKTKLVLIEKEKNNQKYYEPSQLLELRKDIRAFNDFDSQRVNLLEDIKEAFSTRFDIIKIPENFSPELVRSIKNISTYLSNLNDRTPEKETILGFYLSLMVNDRWDDFRNGKEINPRDYVSESKSLIIEKFLEDRKKTISKLTENTGIKDEEISEFIKLLQSETQNVKVGDIETIDIKLNNIVQNLHELQDLDLYPEALDKQRMELLQLFGNKGVGSTVAKIYQQLTNPTKNISLSENEIKIKQQIIDICQATGLDFNNPQVIKEHFQDGIRAFATLVNMSSSVEESNVEGEIEILRKILQPSPEIIDIFNRLGEDFKVSSGAMALSQDLDYLDNLAIKKESLLDPAEKEIISEYILKIKDQVLKLEQVYDQIKSKFENLKQGNSSSQNILLNEKLKEIEKIINSQSTQQVITSTTTNNLNVVIENIRACLSCTEKGCNNDTDLTFGDINKFYVYSQSENQPNNSISDQLVYLEPIVRQDGSNEISFVFDNLYGTRTPSILENQIETVIKKARIIKQKFPNLKISLFVSNSALLSSGLPVDRLVQKFKVEKLSSELEKVEVDIIESAAGDHYIEIGGGARTSGKRKVDGIIVNI